MDVSAKVDGVAAPSEFFSGQVRMAPVVPQREGSGVIAALVRFEVGSRTHWHSHVRGQTLYVVEGEGIVATRGGDVVRVAPGDVIWTPPGEVHWHGAGVSTCMAHLGIVESDESGAHTVWLGAVSDDEFEHAAEGLVD